MSKIIDLSLTSYFKANSTLKVNTIDEQLTIMKESTILVSGNFWDYKQGETRMEDVPQTIKEGVTLTLEELDTLITMLTKARTHIVEQIDNQDPVESVEDYKVSKILKDQRFDKIQSEAGTEEYRGGEDA